MEALYIILLLLCSFFNLSLGELCTGSEVKSNDCSSRELPEGYFRCCFMKATLKSADHTATDVPVCQPLTEEDYNNIENFIKKWIQQHKEIGVDLIFKDIDCRASYLISALYLTFFFCFN